MATSFKITGEMFILMALEVADQLWSTDIRRRIQVNTEGRVDLGPGTLGAKLAILEGQGFIVFGMDTTDGRGRAPRTLCRITPSGRVKAGEYRKLLETILRSSHG